MTAKAFEKIKAGLEEALDYARLDNNFYAPVGKPDFIEMSDETAYRDFEAYCDGMLLPNGVHVLSEESQDIMRRIAERSAALDRHFTKRVS